MLVKCTNTNFERIQSSWIRSNFDVFRDMHERLTLNKLYVVYGIELSVEPFVYIMENDDEEYPRPFPLELFHVVDNRLSRFFCWGHSNALSTNNSGYLRTATMLGLQEWVEDSDFWRALCHGDRNKATAFRRFKERVDIEYFNPNMIQDWGVNISIIGDDWCMCSSCADAWNGGRDNEMLRCPSCGRVFKSPFK